MNVEIFISKQALERLKKDRFVKANKKFYNNEILMIRDSEGTRPVETIGKFKVSPRGHKKIRVVWYFEYDSKKDTLIIYIADLVYHIKEGVYVNQWNKRARTGDISLKNYSGYTLWQPF